MKISSVLILLGCLFLLSCSKNIENDNTMPMLDSELKSSILYEISKIDDGFKASYHDLFDMFLSAKNIETIRSDIYWMGTDEYFSFRNFVIGNGKPAYLLMLYEFDDYKNILGVSYLLDILNEEFSHIVAEVIETYKENPSMDELNMCNEIIENVFMELK